MESRFETEYGLTHLVYRARKRQLINHLLIKLQHKSTNKIRLFSKIIFFCRNKTIVDLALIFIHINWKCVSYKFTEIQDTKNTLNVLKPQVRNEENN